MTVNELIEKIGKRVEYLGNLSMDQLRANYPETTETEAELVRYCKESKFSRGDILSAIIVDEFLLEFDAKIEE